MDLCQMLPQSWNVLQVEGVITSRGLRRLYWARWC